MARFHINYVADCVKDAMDLYVIIPQRKHVRSAESSKLELGSFRAEYPLLLLLHDEASSPLELLSMTRLERFAEEYGVMVALPQGLLSWYTDYADRDSGSNSANSAQAGHIENNFTEMCYEQYVMEALRYLHCTFPALGARDKTYVGGVGMGGFGALKLAMKYPNVFSAAFTLEGDVDLQLRMDKEPGRKEQFDAIFGGCTAEGENNLPARCAAMADQSNAPRLLQLWSPEGVRGEMNRSLSGKLAGSYPGYTGEELSNSWGWDTMDEALRRAVSWL